MEKIALAKMLPKEKLQQFTVRMQRLTKREPSERGRKSRITRNFINRVKTEKKRDEEVSVNFLRGRNHNRSKGKDNSSPSKREIKTDQLAELTKTLTTLLAIIIEKIDGLSLSKRQEQPNQTQKFNTTDENTIFSELEEYENEIDVIHDYPLSPSDMEVILIDISEKSREVNIQTLPKYFEQHEPPAEIIKRINLRKKFVINQEIRSQRPIINFRIPEEITSTLKTVKLADGKTAPIHGKCDCIIDVGDVSRLVTFSIMDTTESMVLGTDFICQFRLQLNMKHKEWWLYGSQKRFMLTTKPFSKCKNNEQFEICNNTPLGLTPLIKRYIEIEDGRPIRQKPYGRSPV
ncbi:hypothetical protein PV328_007739 [Microctonus aethiopoides]|uniref:Uncharacterized protein n=1 Tax=Microctonus aethiopoides TaxID=144406 RepID=A0AA39C9D2_9HYME|nr:hypothetical protein PV328_007739 [Microctonus aethiopoides]